MLAAKLKSLRELTLRVSVRCFYHRSPGGGWSCCIDVLGSKRLIGSARTRGGALEEVRSQLEKFIEGKVIDP